MALWSKAMGPIALRKAAGSLGIDQNPSSAALISYDVPMALEASTFVTRFDWAAILIASAPPSEWPATPQGPSGSSSSRATP